jgi:hypothetical protein
MLQDQPICFDQPQKINDPGNPMMGSRHNVSLRLRWPLCPAQLRRHQLLRQHPDSLWPLSSLNVPATEVMTFISGSTSRQGDTLAMAAVWDQLAEGSLAQPRLAPGYADD